MTDHPQSEGDLFANLPDDDADRLRAAAWAEVQQKGNGPPLWRTPDGGVYSRAEAVARLNRGIPN